MKTSAALLALALATGASAQNVVSFDLKRGAAGAGSAAHPGLARRAATTYTESLINNMTGGGYYAQVSVGTPGQSMTLVLDTGSSDTWVVAYNADLCTDVSMQNYYGATCSATFNANASSTYKMVQANGFEIEYLDGSGSAGSYISDDFTIGGATIKSLEMGYATQTVTGQGIIGMGFDTNEASASIYPNIIDDLASQGLIQSRAFSLYLNDVRSASGNILFGGVDTAKFVGTLGVLPMLKDATTGNYTAYEVTLSSLTAAFSNGTNAPITLGTSTLPAILDSGTTLSYLPDASLNKLAAEVGAYTDVGSGMTFIDCSYLTADTSFTLRFNFGSGSSVTTISLPIAETVLDVLGGYQGDLPQDIPFTNVCLFGVQSLGSTSTNGKRNTKRQGSGGGGGGGGGADDNYALLGDTFLRSAYVVYDLVSTQVGLAQSNLNTTDTSITELGTAGLTAMTGVATQQTTATGSGAPQQTVGVTGGGTQTGSGGPTVTVTTPAHNAGARPTPPFRGDALAVWLVSVVCAVVGGALFAI